MFNNSFLIFWCQVTGGISYILGYLALYFSCWPWWIALLQKYHNHGQNTTFWVNFIIFSKFGPNLFINGTNCHNFLFSCQKYWCRTSKFSCVPWWVAFLQKHMILQTWPKNHISGQFHIFFSKFGPNLFINGTSCHSFVFASHKYWCSTSNYWCVARWLALLQKYVASWTWPKTA